MKKVFLSMLAIAGLFVASCSGDDDGPIIPTGPTINPANFTGNFTTGAITLDASITYNLTGPVVINDGVTLTIPAGTKIEASGGTSAYIAIAQGGQIFVNGTASNPVVMTSAAASPSPGDWGGLVLCGRAPINKAATATAEVSDLTYGGTTSNDNSGSLRYLRVEYSGAVFNGQKEFNGVSFFGVGSGTTIEFIQSVNADDDGFEFFGGTVNASNLVVINPTDDAFDWTEGWVGTGTNWYAVMNNGRGHRGIEADNLEDNNTATPYSDPTISNVSIVGNGDGTEDDGFKIRRGTKGDFTNIFIEGRDEGIEVDDPQTEANLLDGSLTFSDIRFVTTEKAFDIFDADFDNGDGTTGSGIDYITIADAQAAYAMATITESTTAAGAGAGADAPSWTTGWTTGL
ncbi:hypothetical protein [uncultured Aquimarina sp.]|uniref:hypothetical protein n=1 Tax=uncultured Aquimarina sp. TaxID=575652 RepID=UPI00262EFB8F|nr:hypothetical protein [uncultured Aquimarina sp.]